MHLVPLMDSGDGHFGSDFLAALWSDPDIKTLFVKAAFIPPAIIFVIGIMLAWAFGRFPRR